MLQILILVLALAQVALAVDPPEYQEAERLVQKEDWNGALALLKGLLARYPDNPKVLNLDGLALTGAGRTSEARTAFERALHFKPDFSPALKNLSIVEWNAGVPQAAARTETALKLEPVDPVLNAYGALGAMAHKDRQLAVKRLETAGAAVAVLPIPLLDELAFQLAENGLYPQSISVFQVLVRAGPDSPAIRYNLALAQFRAGRYSDSIQTLEPLRSKALSADAMNLLAQSYERTGAPQKAVDTLRAAIASDPRDENNYIDLANICVENGALDKAAAVVEAGLSYRPDSGRLNFEAGLLSVFTRDFDRAQTSFERAASLEPESDLPQAAIELATIQQTRLAEAIAGLRRQLQEKPRSGVLWYLLGTALTHSGAATGNAEQQEAATAYQTAIQVDPKLPWPYVELAKIYLRRQRPEDAAPLLEKAISLDPAARPAYYQLALAYRELKKPDLSREMLAKVRELNAREHGLKLPSQKQPEDR